MGAKEYTAKELEMEMAGHLPNDVAASLDPVVKDGEAGVGDKVGETHDCVCLG